MAEVVIVESPEAGGTLVARHIAKQVRGAPDFTLGVATGSTPLPVYSALARERVDTPEEVPTRLITQGIGTILRGGLVLSAFGAGKADAIAVAVEGPVTASLPGSCLQLHAHVTVVVDEAAATGFDPSTVGLAPRPRPDGVESARGKVRGGTD